MYKPVNEEELYSTSNIVLKAKENDLDFSNMGLLIVDDIKQLRRLQVVLIFTYNEETEIEDKFKDAPTYIFGADSIEDIYIIGD